jgi:hypothetical protein
MEELCDPSSEILCTAAPQWQTKLKGNDKEKELISRIL